MTDTAGTTTVANRHSPCIGICRLDVTTGWCDGCGRTGTEIARWIDASDAERLAIFDRLPERLARTGMETRVLPWTADELIDRIAAAARDGATRWSVGRLSTAPGLSLPAGSADRVTVDASGVTIVAGDRALRLLRHEKLRGFGDVPADRFIGLGLPKGRAVLPSVAATTDLGPDSAALLSGPPAHLFDLALGTPMLRVALRPAEGRISSALAKAGSKSWASIGGTIVDSCADEPLAVVAETILVRIETRTLARHLPALLNAMTANQDGEGPAALVPAWAAPMLYGARPGA